MADLIDCLMLQELKRRLQEDREEKERFKELMKFSPWEAL